MNMNRVNSIIKASTSTNNKFQEELNKKKKETKSVSISFDKLLDEEINKLKHKER